MNDLFVLRYTDENSEVWYWTFSNYTKDLHQARLFTSEEEVKYLQERLMATKPEIVKVKIIEC